MSLQGLLDLADSLGKESAPVCALSYYGEGSKMMEQCEVQDDEVSVARLSVGVDQLSNNYVGRGHTCSG